jgi:hypothetical protein
MYKVPTSGSKTKLHHFCGPQRKKYYLMLGEMRQEYKKKRIEEEHKPKYVHFQTLFQQYLVILSNLF